MAGAPNPGTSQEAGQSADSSAGTGEADDEIEIGQVPDNGIVDDAGAASAADSQVVAAPAASPSPTTESEKAAVRAVLSGPAMGGIINSDSMSKVFVLDQTYTALGDNGLTATFTFNPTADEVFTSVNVEVDVETYVFEFKPANTQVITGKNAADQDVYILVGDATFLFDEFGEKWSKTELGKSRIKIEVVMEADGTTVKSINLAIIGR
jgi:hypothetical protein